MAVVIELLELHSAEGHAETREHEIMAAYAKHEIVDAGAQLCPLVGRWRGGFS